MDQSKADSTTIPDGKHCPKCSQDIGIWPVILAIWPDRIRCPYCRTRLVYRNTLAVFLVLLIIALPLCMIACFAVIVLLSPHDTDPVGQTIAFTLLLIAAWLPIDFVATIYLRANKILTRVKKKERG